MAALIIAGESVFLLPFILARVFRPTLLDVFRVSNLELGAAYSVYGVVAIAAYLFGGLLADRFPPRAMLTVALMSTAVGGLVMMAIPSPSTLAILYGYWGITTIALFWAPLIRATREWGLNFSQSRAFGLLEGGRGALSAVMASIMVVLFAALLPADSATASFAQRTESLRQIILLLSAVTCGAALLIWLALPARKTPPQQAAISLRGAARVFAMPSVWLQAAVILCAYVGFKAIDDFSLYANQVIGLNEVDAARIGVTSLWIRPIAAIGAGYLAERTGAPIMTVGCFILLAGGSAVLGSGAIGAGMAWAFVLTVIFSSIGIFGLRGLYFAIMQDGKIPVEHTGSAVGLMSVIGYAPDIFMGPLMGYLLDQWPGAAGHNYLFRFVTLFAMLGLIASYLFLRLAQRLSGPSGAAATP